MKIPFVDLQSQYQSIKEEADAAVLAVMGRGDFILGQAVSEFEKEFARYCEADHCVGVDSGYSALELILRGYGIGPDDEVITAANTFVATALAISNTGARPSWWIWTQRRTISIRAASRRPSRPAPGPLCRSISTASPRTWILSWPSRPSMI